MCGTRPLRTLRALDEIVDLFGGPLQSAVRVRHFGVELFQRVQLTAQLAVDLATYLTELHHRVAQLTEVLILPRVDLILVLRLVVDKVLVVAPQFVFEAFVARVLTRGIDQGLQMTRVKQRSVKSDTYIALIHLNAHLGLQARQVLFECTHCAACRVNVALAALNLTALHETLALYNTCEELRDRVYIIVAV